VTAVGPRAENRSPQKTARARRSLGRPPKGGRPRTAKEVDTSASFDSWLASASRTSRSAMCQRSGCSRVRRRACWSETWSGRQLTDLLLQAPSSVMVRVMSSWLYSVGDAGPAGVAPPPDLLRQGIPWPGCPAGRSTGRRSWRRHPGRRGSRADALGAGPGHGQGPRVRQSPAWPQLRCGPRPRAG
jgi:hypothetical protein